MAAAATLAGCSAPSKQSRPSDSLSLPNGTPSSTSEQVVELVSGNAGFALELHRKFVGNEENTFISPYSISMALAMTYAGAEGATETSMAETLGFSLGRETHPTFSELQQQLDARATTKSVDPDRSGTVNAFQLVVANALWGQSDGEFAEAYLDLIDTYYNGGFNTVDFDQHPEQARQRINEWVADNTNNRIQSLLRKESLGPTTRLVLTSAIYFKAPWRLKFDPEETVQGSFTTLDGRETTVAMMQQNLETQYAEFPGARAIELPYIGDKVSMVVIVPDADEFERVEANLTASNLFGIFDALGETSGRLRMPKFEYEFGAPLSEPLESLGIDTAFAPAADFSGMVDSGTGPYIGEVKHRSFISVDEKGTEASASTVVFNLESGPIDPFELSLDRPFLYCIRDRPSDAILFFGRVTNARNAQPLK
jgi:serpin B